MRQCCRDLINRVYHAQLFWLIQLLSIATVSTDVSLQNPRRLLRPSLRIVGADLVLYQQLRPKLTLDDIAITVKTTRKCFKARNFRTSLHVSLLQQSSNYFTDHYTRLVDILDTWFRDAPPNTFFITDESDPTLLKRLGARLVATECGQGHNHRSLNCKLQKELQLLAHINAKWSCHFDDDNYVNVPQLLRTLSKYDPLQPYYIGRLTVDAPVNMNGVAFNFATGGAGICLSQALIHQIYPHLPKFHRLTVGFVAPDDVTLGYLITAILRVPLTTESALHSHLHQLTPQQLKNLHKQATLGPLSALSWRLNPLSRKDERLFYALHCHNFPDKCRTVSERLQNR